MGGSKKDYAIGREEYHSVSRLIFGSLLCKLKSLCKSKPRLGSTPPAKRNTYVFHDESPEAMSDKYNGACVLVKWSAIPFLMVSSFMTANLVPLFPASPQVRDEGSCMVVNLIPADLS